MPLWGGDDIWQKYLYVDSRFLFNEHGTSPDIICKADPEVSAYKQLTLKHKWSWRHFGSAWKSSIRRFVFTEKASTRAFSWLKAATTAVTFKTLLRHYAKRALTPRSLKVKLGPRRNYHKGRAIRHYANQTARPLWPLRCGPNFTLRDRGVNAHLA